MMEGERVSIDGGLDPELLGDLGVNPAGSGGHDDITAMLEGSSKPTEGEDEASPNTKKSKNRKKAKSHWDDESFGAGPSPLKETTEVEARPVEPAFAAEEVPEAEDDGDFNINLGDTPRKASGNFATDFSISLDDNGDDTVGPMQQSTYLDATASANESVDLSASTPQAQGYLGPGGGATRAARGSTVDVHALMKGELLSVSVVEPTKTGDGMNAYVSYTVNTKTSLSEFSDTHFSVTRRYRDFAWLQQALVDSHSGHIIPPIPDKQSLGRFASEFLELRRRGLEKFLNRLARNPALYLDPSFQTFLCASDDVLESAKKSHAESTKKHAAPSKGIQMFKDLRTSIAGRAPTESYKDEILDNAMPYLNAFGTQLNNLIKHSERSARRHKEMGTCLTEVALASNVVAAQEKDYLSHAFTQLSQCIDRVSVLNTEQGEKDENGFVESLKDYYRIVNQVKVALDSRQQNLITLHAASHDLEQKKHKTESLQNNPKSTPQIIEAMEKATQEAEEKLYSTKDQYNRVADVLKSELRRFGTEKMHDFKDIMTEYIQSQVEYSTRVTKAWSQLIPELEANIPGSSKGQSQS